MMRNCMTNRYFENELKIIGYGDKSHIELRDLILLDEVLLRGLMAFGFSSSVVTRSDLITLLKLIHRS